MQLRIKTIRKVKFPNTGANNILLATMSTGKDSPLIVPVPPNWINIGDELGRWNSLKVELQQNSNEKLAKLLMDVFNNYKPLTTLCKRMDGTSSDSDEPPDQKMEPGLFLDHDYLSYYNNPGRTCKPNIDEVSEVEVINEPCVSDNERNDGMAVGDSEGGSDVISEERNVKKKEETIYICDICCANFTSEDVFSKHRLTHLKEMRTVYICKYCNEVFPYKELRDLHVSRHSDNTPNMCQYCGEMFLQRGQCVEHEVSEHSAEMPYHCDCCNKGFVSLINLQKHKRRRPHQVEKPHRCKFCSTGFARKESRVHHEMIHTGEKPYSCQFCEKTFRRQSTHRRHERTHTGEKPFKRRFCEKRFPETKGRQFHEKRVHTDPFLYKCQHCRKKFRDQKDCSEHEALHLFLCHLCEKQFLLRSSLEIHLKKVHDELSK
ncbi:zinc finger protein 271 [Lingula anatina]|uniref:Zinc finger protein 271 n=1 Tax=Lingula anatina TaxID=7574 RepID=A0A1S3JQW5_LINAN|nr:zinc finger protein 271 [Lingula anatina]|eukprot:XP_013412755.1 zinc finger protein 271 [Lingula anatina]